MRITRILPIVVTGVLTTPLLALAGGSVSASTAPSYDTIWTVDSAANSISEYAAGAHGSAAPLATISGVDTQLAGPSAVAVGTDGKILVANKTGNSITEYAAGATNDAAPIATISGPHTGLDAPSSIALAGARIWVTDPADNLVESFSADAHGNALPASTIAGEKTKLDHPIALTASDAFEFIMVLNAPVAGGGDLTMYDPEQVGNVSPLSVIKGTKKAPFSSPTAITQRDDFSVWVADAGTNSATDYFALPIPGAPTETLQRIVGSKTGISHPIAISHDAQGRIYVGNGSGNTVKVFGPDAQGNVAPASSLTGVGSALSQPTAVSVYGTVPAEPTNLRAVRHGRKVHLTWDPPAVTGGGVVAYGVQQSTESSDDLDGLSALLGELTSGSGSGTSTTRTSITRTIKPGVRYDFNVFAINGFGQGPMSATVHAAIVRAPGAVAGIHLLVHGHDALVLWNPPAKDGGASHLRYRLEYGTCVPGASGCTFKTKHTGIPFTVLRKLKKHTTYHVRIIAADKAGVGPASTVRTLKVKG